MDDIKYCLRGVGPNFTINFCSSLLCIPEPFKMSVSEEQVKILIEESNRARDEQWRQLLEASKADKALARTMKINQEKSKYDKPQDKRAVGFLMDAKFDTEDLMDSIRGLFDEAGNLLDNNKIATDQALRFLVGWGEMRTKKIARETESYDVANRSRFGWATEKFYRQEDLFNKEGDQWWTKDDLSPAEKSTKFNKAETKARYHLLDLKKTDNKRKFQDGDVNFNSYEKKSRWGPAPGAAFTATSSSAAAAYPSMPGSSPYTWPGSGGYVNYAPAASFQPPRVPPKCFKCNEVGHVQKDCKK